MTAATAPFHLRAAEPRDVGAIVRLIRRGDALRIGLAPDSGLRIENA